MHRSQDEMDRDYIDEYLLPELVETLAGIWKAQAPRTDPITLDETFRANISKGLVEEQPKSERDHVAGLVGKLWDMLRERSPLSLGTATPSWVMVVDGIDLVIVPFSGLDRIIIAAELHGNVSGVGTGCDDLVTAISICAEHLEFDPLADALRLCWGAMDEEQRADVIAREEVKNLLSGWGGDL